MPLAVTTILDRYMTIGTECRYISEKNNKSAL